MIPLEFQVLPDKILEEEEEEEGVKCVDEAFGPRGSECLSLSLSFLFLY